MGSCCMHRVRILGHGRFDCEGLRLIKHKYIEEDWKSFIIALASALRCIQSCSTDIEKVLSVISSIRRTCD